MFLSTDGLYFGVSKSYDGETPEGGVNLLRKVGSLLVETYH